ncbi:MAG: hypothetical protein RR087_05585 [Oscillospiraceae bacterium]
MKNIFKTLSQYILAFVIATALYIVLLNLGLFSSISVFFYRAIAVLIFTVLVVLVGILLLNKLVKQLNFDWKDVFITCLATLCAHMVFLSLVTVSLDRSLSVFLLCYMNDNSQVALSENDIETVFQDVFVDEYKMLERRFTEQIITGTIEEKNGGYHITKRGEFLVDVFRFLGGVFPVDEKCLYPAIGENVTP